MENLQQSTQLLTIDTVFPIHWGTPYRMYIRKKKMWYSHMHSEKCGRNKRQAGK